jgi:ABC-type multidrug transport system fused ATPase/permease subunit
MNHEEIINDYQQKLDEEQESLRYCASRWSTMSYLRGGTFLLSLVPLILALNSVWGFTTGWLVFAGLIFLGFLVIAFIHEGMQTELRRATLLSTMHRESLARCHRKWAEINMPSVEIPRGFLAVSTDLDLLTENSVFKLLGTTRTPLGIATLRSWIIEGAPAAEIKLRQSAVAELKPELDWRLKFRLLCEQLALGRSGPSRFVDWSESSSWFAGRQWVLWLSRATSIGSLLSMIVLLTGWVPLTIAGPLLIGTCAINFGLSVWFAGSLHDVFNQISSRADEALHYVTMFDMVSDFPAKSEKLKSLQVLLHDPSHDAQRSVQRLGKLTWLANIRRNGILFIPYLIFEFLFFWDVHCLDLLERWKHSNGQYVRGWFSDLGEWEALCALAKLASDEPEWRFPEVIEKQSPLDAVIVSEQLGHPLLDKNRVLNDVTVGPPGSVLLVTGSNMSGKSTLLRSIGVNVVLAQMGSVVCAKSMRLPAIHIESSMRIADSLADGVSFFMAELKRLKEIVDTAKRLDVAQSKTMLFLLDEILQGTNSRERQIAVSRVVRKLIDEHAIGAISTHDLDLAKTDELASACQTVHFAEQFLEEDGEKKMTFDYRMQPGIAKTTNALTLLEMVGLGK